MTSLAVWAEKLQAGILAREGRRQYVFSCAPGAAAEAAVSLTSLTAA
jgi:hypothetical protein